MKSLKQFKTQINEVLTKKTPLSQWIHDFVHSDDPKFDGKSKDERIKMAQGAYYGAQKEAVEKATGGLKDACWKGYTAVGTKKKNGRTVPNCVPVNEDGSEITIGEGKMAELHASLSQHLDKHVAEYKRAGGAESLGHKSTVAAQKISKEHGIAAHHAQKFVNDYIENKLKESMKEDIKAEHAREAVEYKGIGTDVVDKKKKLNPQPNLTTAKKQVKDFKEEVQIDELSKGLVARYANKVAKTTQANYDKSKDKFQFSSGRQDGMKNAVKRLTKEDLDLIEAMTDKDKLRQALDRHTEKAVAANKCGDDEACKVHQGYINKIKTKMGKLAKEEVEQIDELSKGTLSSYVKKAHKDNALTANDLGHQLAMSKKPGLSAGTDPTYTKGKNKYLKRSDNIDKAVSKLAKEEVELEESRGHKVIATFLKNREVAKRAYQGNPAKDAEVAQGGGSPADQGIAAAKKDYKKLNKEGVSMLNFNDFLKEGKCGSMKKEELKGNQHKLDKNKNGKLDAHDFKLLRKEEAEQIDEAKYGIDVHRNKLSKILTHASNAGIKAKVVSHNPNWEKQNSDGEHTVTLHGKDEHVRKFIQKHHDSDPQGTDDYKEYGKSLKEEAEQIDEGKFKEIYTDMMHHATKKGYSSHKQFTPADYDTVGKQHGISGKELAVALGHKTVAQVTKEEVKDKKDSPPFDPDPKPTKKVTPGKYGQGYSQAKHLAQKGMKSLTKEDLDQFSLDEINEFMTTEYYHQLDEISKETLASYIPKAAKSARIHGQISTEYKKSSERKKNPGLKNALDSLSTKYKKKAWDREDNIKKAVGKLTKEDIDLDEVEKVSYTQFIKSIEEGKIDDYLDKKRADANTASAYDKKKTSTKQPSVTINKGRAYGGSNQKDDEGDEKPETAEKRGRGRPTGSKSGARQKGNGHNDGGIPVHNLNLPTRNNKF